MSGEVKGEKFPLAAQRVVVEFKLRRAKGCKISKLWPKKKTRKKIAVCYGKEEAEKFNASSSQPCHCFQVIWNNLELWHDKLSARERRILMTKWAGAPWRKLVKDFY